MKKLIALVLVVLCMICATIPALAASASIKKTEYEGSGKVEVDFKKDVQYKSAKVTVKDSAGKSYTAKITEKDSDEMEVRVSGLKKGTKYTVKVSGVRLKSAGGNYGSVSKSITVK